METLRFLCENDPSTSDDDGAIFWHVPHYKHSSLSAHPQGWDEVHSVLENGDNLRDRRETEDGCHVGKRALRSFQQPRGIRIKESLRRKPTSRLRARDHSFNWLKRVDAVMPTAVKRTNQQGTIQEWYSQWMAKQHPSQNGSDPLEEAVTDADDGDTIHSIP